MDCVYALQIQQKFLGSKCAFIFKTEWARKGKVSRIHAIVNTKQHCYRYILSNARATCSSWFLVSLGKLLCGTGAEQRVCLLLLLFRGMEL